MAGSNYVPDALLFDGRRDYQRGWMIRNDRTGSVAVSTEKLAFMLVNFVPKDVQFLRELLGEATCKAALDKHTLKKKKNGDLEPAAKSDDN